MDLQEAYKLLGVSENTTDDEIEKQYMTWVRRDNAHESQPDKTQKHFDMEQITDAYNTIISYEKYGSESPKEFNSFREKFGHFFHYYKFHLLGGVVLIVICVSIIHSFLDNRQEQRELASLPPESVSIMLYGDYFGADISTEPVTENVLSEFPSWERVTANATYAPTEANGAGDVGMQQKSVVTLISDKSDVYIMDPENFEKLVKNGMFLPLDEMEATLEEKQGKNELIYAKTEEDSTKHAFGVEITDSTIFDGLQVNEDKKIAAIRLDTKNEDNAKKLVLEFID